MNEHAVRALVERARTGDAEAFAALFGCYERDVARLCRRMLGAGPAAEDAANEVFLRTRRAFESFDNRRPFRPWLLAIASHHCVDRLRRAALEARLFDPRELEAADLPDGGPSPLRQALRAEQSSALVAAIDALPPQQRLPIVLRHFAELDYAAIAELLGATRNQVGALLFRARRELRRRLESTGGNEA
ncbi:MAG: sigma-70 family RNA polymerase sigma factor [Myxococcota bacterium]